MFAKTIAAAALSLAVALPAFAADKTNIIDTAHAAGEFKTLIAAVDAAGLTETLKGKGPFTVFAPTDAAFAALPAGTVESLLKPENKAKLASILTYHVLPGKVTSSQLTEGMKAKTVEGADVMVTLKDGPKVNGVKISKADIEASNGVIHVIDAVLMPPAK